MKVKVLEAYHNASIIEHPRYYKTYQKIRERFVWKDLKNDVLSHLGMYLMPIEQGGTRILYQTSVASSHFGAQAGEYIHGLYYWIS